MIDGEKLTSALSRIIDPKIVRASLGCCSRMEIG
jgi:hypothetical protein